MDTVIYLVQIIIPGLSMFFSYFWCFSPTVLMSFGASPLEAIPVSGFVISVPILRDEEVVERVIQLQPPLKDLGPVWKTATEGSPRIFMEFHGYPIRSYKKNHEIADVRGKMRF